MNMGKWLIALKIVIQFFKKPSSSYYVVVENICKEEMKKRPDSFYSRWFLGELYLRYNQFEQSLNVLEPLNFYGGGGKKLKFMLARAYFNLGKFEKVIDLLKNLEIKDRDSATYYLGHSLIEKGSSEQGISLLERYLVHHPKDYNILWKLGYEYFRVGNYEKALKAYMEAKQIKPNSQIEKDIGICHKKN